MAIDELGNSVTLRKYKFSNYPELNKLVDSIYKKMIRVPGLVGSRPSDLDKLRWHIEFFLMNLHVTYLKDPKRYIALPRSSNRYSKDPLFRDTFKLSYEYSVKKVVKFLHDNKYVKQSSFIHDPLNPSRNKVTRIRATKKLINRIKKPKIVTPHQLQADESDKELIVVKGVKLKDRWATKTVDGVSAKVKIKGKRRICKTPDTPQVRKMRENLKKINAVMHKAEITLDITEEELQQLNARLRADHDPNKQAVDFSRKSLHRVFLDRRLDRGGRFYGAWYQNIPSEYRERISIDGAPVLEPDFSGYHPRILYALKGLPLPEDPYFLKDYPQTDEMRKFLKTLLLSIVNAKDKKDAIGGMRGARFDEHKKAYREGKELQPLGIEPLTDNRYLEIMQKFTDRHKPIQEYFYSDSGTFLQNIDSQIAEYIMLYFADMGHPCLPMHDSFIVDARLESKLRWVMEEVFRQGLNQKIDIKHNMEQLVERLAFRLVDDRKSGNIDDDRWEEIENGLRETMQEVEKILDEHEAQADIDPE